MHIHYHSYLEPSVCQAENREVVEFVRHAEDILGAHQRVARMNFIPGDYKMPTTVWEARVEPESQFVVSGVGDIDMVPPSPTYDDDFRDAEHVELPPSPAEEDQPPLPADEYPSSSSEHEDRPPSARDDDLLPACPDSVHNVSPHEDEGRPPAQETTTMRDVDSPPMTDPQTLKLDIRKPPPSEELIQRVAKILKAPLSTSKGVARPKKKKVVVSSPLAPTQEDHPEDELSPPHELRSMTKQDKRPRKKPKG